MNHSRKRDFLDNKLKSHADEAAVSHRSTPTVPGSAAVQGVVSVTALRRPRLMHSSAPNPATSVHRRPSLTPAPVSVNYPRGGLVMIGRVARQQSDKTGLLMMPRSARCRRQRVVHIETMKRRAGGIASYANCNRRHIHRCTRFHTNKLPFLCTNTFYDDT